MLVNPLLEVPPFSNYEINAGYFCNFTTAIPNNKVTTPFSAETRPAALSSALSFTYTVSQYYFPANMLVLTYLPLYCMSYVVFHLYTQGNIIFYFLLFCSITVDGLIRSRIYDPR